MFRESGGDLLSRRTIVVAVANQKGGVGKSTTAINLGAGLATRGEQVLVVDLDPQANATSGLGIDRAGLEKSTYHLMIGDTTIDEVIEGTAVRGLYVIPSNIDLAGAEIELVSMMSRERRLSMALKPAVGEYDTVLIDCPPSLGLLTVNALCAADEVLIPIQCEYYALEGVTQLLQNVDLIRSNLNPLLDVKGVVLTMFDVRTTLSNDVAGQVRKHFGDKAYETVIPRSVRLSEAPSYGEPIQDYDPEGRGATAYRQLTTEFRKRHGRS